MNFSDTPDTYNPNFEERRSQYIPANNKQRRNDIQPPRRQHSPDEDLRDGEPDSHLEPEPKEEHED